MHYIPYFLIDNPACFLVCLLLLMFISDPTQQSTLTWTALERTVQGHPSNESSPGSGNTLACHCKKLMICDCSVQASTVASIENDESNPPEDAPKETTKQTTQNTASTRHTHSKGAACMATKSQLEGEIGQRLQK